MAFLTKSPMPRMIDWQPVDLDGTKCHTLMVTGSREYTDLKTLTMVLDSYYVEHERKIADGDLEALPLVLISGHANRGADVLAEMVWAEYGPIFTEPAKWDEHTPSRCKCHDNPAVEYCRLAGIIRNEKMVDVYKPSVVVAFYEPTAENRGTNHAAEYAREQDIPVRIILGAEISKAAVAEPSKHITDPSQF